MHKVILILSLLALCQITMVAEPTPKTSPSSSPPRHFGSERGSMGITGSLSGSPESSVTPPLYRFHITAYGRMFERKPVIAASGACPTITIRTSLPLKPGFEYSFIGQDAGEHDQVFVVSEVISESPKPATTYAADTRIVFENRPESGIPREAKLQEKVDPHSHGTMAQVLGETLQTVTVRYFSSDVWADQKQVSDYLAGLLKDQRTEIYTFQIWSQGVGEPEIECILTFKNHRQGRLLLWGTTACLRDEAGKWWFVSTDAYYHHKHPKGDRGLVRKAIKNQ